MVKRTYGTHKNLNMYVCICSLTVFGPIYYGSTKRSPQPRPRRNVPAEMIASPIMLFMKEPY